MLKPRAQKPLRSTPTLLPAIMVNVPTSGTATEHSGEPQLAELLSNAAGATGQYELQVRSCNIIDYTYTYQNREVKTQKLEVELQSPIPEQYCLGIAKLKAGDKKELQRVLDRFKKGTTWKCSKVKLLEEKPAFIHTTCRIAIDLRKSQFMPVLQSVTFPKAPAPTCAIADVLQLKQLQRFDLMAVPAKVMAERRTGGGIPIADVRLVDGSKDPNDSATEPANASLPLTIFFKGDTHFNTFKKSVGCEPLLFMCLSGNRGDDGKVQVRTVKDMFWWEAGAGDKYESMKANAATLSAENASFTDVASLREYQALEAADYTGVPATLTACRLMDPPAEHLLEDGKEHLYQMNHVYVPAPTKCDSIKTRKGDRLFAQLDCTDYSKRITLAFRSKAMLALAGLQDGMESEYEQRVENDELRHTSLLSSLRVRIKKTSVPYTADAASGNSQESHAATEQMSAIVVEAEPCTLTNIPNDSVEAIHGLLAALAPTSDRLATVFLHRLQPSPFYNMMADSEAADKSLALLKFTQRTSGKQICNGYRIVSERVQDATNPTDTNQYGTIALCTVETSPDYTAKKDTVAICVLSKVTAPSNTIHAVDLYIEAMEVVPATEVQPAIEMMCQLQRASAIHRGDATGSIEAAWEQRKCRRLCRYPTRT